jgi:hypothetical protein
MAALPAIAYRKAWVTPEGTIIDIPIGSHHINALPPDVPWNDSTKLGWIRLTLRSGITLDIEGWPARVETEKQNILAWAGPRVKWVNIDPDTSGGLGIETSPEALEEQSIQKLMWHARMTGATVFRRRPVLVRQYRRKRNG